MLLLFLRLFPGLTQDGVQPGLPTSGNRLVPFLVVAVLLTSSLEMALVAQTKAVGRHGNPLGLFMLLTFYVAPPQFLAAAALAAQTFRNPDQRTILTSFVLLLTVTAALAFVNLFIRP